MDGFLNAASKQELLKQLDWRGWPPMSDKGFDERRQGSALLMGLAMADRLPYPVICVRQGERNPDLWLTSGDESVGIEASRIASTNLEALRRWHRKQKTVASLAIGSLAVGGGSNKLSINIDEALVDQPNALPPTAEEYEEFWLKQTRDRIEKKTAILRRGDFRRGSQNWLLLWDTLSIGDTELERRVLRLRGELEHYWLDSPRFTKIFVHDRELRLHYLLDPSTPLDQQVVIHGLL